MLANNVGNANLNEPTRFGIREQRMTGGVIVSKVSAWSFYDFDIANWIYMRPMNSYWTIEHSIFGFDYCLIISKNVCLCVSFFVFTPIGWQNCLRFAIQRSTIYALFWTMTSQLNWNSIRVFDRIPGCIPLDNDTHIVFWTKLVSLLIHYFRIICIFWWEPVKNVVVKLHSGEHGRNGSTTSDIKMEIIICSSFGLFSRKLSEEPCTRNELTSFFIRQKPED